MVLRPSFVTAITATLAAAITVLVALIPPLHFAYRSVSLHAALETAAAVIALLAATLVFGRFRESGRISDLALVSAFSVLAATNLVFAALPAAIPEVFDRTFATWSAVIGSVIGSGLLALAAFAPDVKARHPRSSAAIVFAVLSALLGLIAVILAGLVGDLPAGVEPGLAAGNVELDGHVAVVFAQIAAAVYLGIAAIGFTRKAQRQGDELLRWLAIAATLGLFARINFALFPSLYSQWVSTGDLLRFAFYVALLIGAEREIRFYQRRMAAIAVLEERRRIARELHDGLAHELAYIAQHSRVLEEDRHAPFLQIAAAAERAMDESRRAIAALTRPLDEPFDVAVAATAEEVALRLGADLQLDLETDIQVDSDTREALLRVVREAMTNAARHGRAESITVELSNWSGLKLRVVDNGAGFDPGQQADRPGAFGLVSMRERVHALGGEFNVTSKPGAGTSIDIALP